MERRITRTVKAGNVEIGSGSKITVQSMLNALAHDIEGNVAQAVELEKAGCEIVRLTVPDIEAVKTLYAVKNAVKIPVVADIHFDYKCALESVAAGVDKIRINPGNIGSDDRIKAVADACRQKNIPIRIGVNSGSLEKDLLKKFDFNDIVISIKSSDVPTMVAAYRLVAQQCDYPLHLGVTEAGTRHMGMLKSAAGIGALLLDGIGDTIRVSLTADPVSEVAAGFDILKAVGIKKDCPQIVSCPTCGRTKIDLISLAEKVEKELANVHKPIKVAVMGCAVNGPGEAKEADIGVAGGDGYGLIFKHGEILKKVPENKIVEELLKEIDNL